MSAHQCTAHFLYTLFGARPALIIGCTPTQVLLDGKVVAALERSCPRQVQLPEVLVFFSQVTVLDIVVHAMGRQSGGCEWDFKGLVYPNIQLNGTLPPCALPPQHQQGHHLLRYSMSDTVHYLVRLSHA